MPDEVLTTLYRIASAVIMPSEGEGFGFPLVEPACQGVLVIALALPVFREVGGDGAFNFATDSGDQLEHALFEWIKYKLRYSGQAPDPTLRWMLSADQLIACVKGCRTAMPS
jgi:glycosyltransferase involved in cell wall biosynthesis